MKYSVFYHHVLAAAKEKGLSVEDMLDEIRGMGISYVELDRNDIGADDEKILAFSEMLKRHDIKPSNICGYYSFNASDELPDEDDLMIRQALMIGCERVMVIPGFYSDLSDTEKCRIEKERMIRGTGKIAEYASAHGLCTTIECYDNKKSPISTIGGNKDFIDAIPELGITLETGNFLYADEDILIAEELFRNRVRHVHLKDRYLPSKVEGEAPKEMLVGSPIRSVGGVVLYPCAVGYGHVPVKEVIGKILNNGYDGIFTIEHFGVASYYDAIRDSAAWLLANE